MSGPTVLVDSNVFVSARNRREPGFAACRRFLDRIDRGEVRAIVSTVTIAEIRAGFTPEEIPTAWRALLTHVLTSPNYRTEPVDSTIAEAAGELRARVPITLPDAMIVATGRLRGAAFLVTQDRDLGRQQPDLPTRGPAEVD